MPLNPGVLVLTFNPPGRFVVDRLHKVPASSGLSSFTQGGSTKQTTTVKDKVNNTAYSEATDKFITPFNASTELVEAEWYIEYTPPGASKPKDYRVLGAHRIPDGWGRVSHCTFICKEENG